MRHIVGHFGDGHFTQSLALVPTSKINSKKNIKKLDNRQTMEIWVACTRMISPKNRPLRQLSVTILCQLIKYWLL